MNSQLTVTVLVMTYNHASFIVQALDGILMQEVAFNYEIVISEDDSTDGTQEIVIHYQKRYPDKIRLLLSEKNIRSNEIVVRGINAARGQYIALLDGDDYWTAADKLQKQVNFLENHPECALCFHNAKVIHNDEDRKPWNWNSPDQKVISNLEDIWMGNFIATCSTMFRRGLVGRIPQWYIPMFPITDWPLHILNAERGKIGYINEIMGVYRYHKGGLYSPCSEAQKLEETLKFYNNMNRNMDFMYTKIINSAISKYFFEWAEEYMSRNDLGRAKACYKTCLQGRPFNKFISLKHLIRMGIKLYTPRIKSKNFNSRN